MNVTRRALLTLAVAMAAGLLLTFAHGRVAPAHAGTTFTVMSQADTGDSAPGDGVCDDGTSQCTLRAAIEEANALSGADTINFSISGGTSLQTIAPLTALPVITEDVTIDGLTQNISSGLPSVQLSGGSCTGCAYGLAITGGTSTILRGFVINGFSSGAGIAIAGSSTATNTVTRNYLGTNDTGTIAAANSVGLLIAASSSNTVSDNLVSGNTNSGVWITGCVPPPGSGCGTTDTNVLERNKIGTNVAGTAAVGNGHYGVDIDGTAAGVSVASNAIGSFASADRNLISGNGLSGLAIRGADASANVLTATSVGTNAAGSGAIPNGSHGVYITGGAHGNNIEGSTGLNDIAFNHGAGIAVDGGGTGNFIWDNTIHDNDGLGIDNAPLGAVTPGIQGQVDAALACPSCNGGLGTLTLTGFAHALPPNSSIAVGVYLNTACDPSGFGEGAIFPHPGTWYIPAISVTSDANGDISGAAQNTQVGNVVGEFVTTYAVFPDHTSTEFTGCLQVKSDQDGDGIEDAIDSNPSVASNSFTDVPLGGTTFGTIADRGSFGSCYVSVVDLPGSDGVILGTVCPAGGGPAHVQMCGQFTVAMTDGTSVRETCGSLHNGVDIGPVTVTFGPPPYVATLPTNTVATINDLGAGHFSVTNDAASASSVAANPPPVSIPPGQTMTLPVPPSVGGFATLPQPRAQAPAHRTPYFFAMFVVAAAGSFSAAGWAYRRRRRRD